MDDKVYYQNSVQEILQGFEPMLKIRIRDLQYLQTTMHQEFGRAFVPAKHREEIMGRFLAECWEQVEEETRRKAELEKLERKRGRNRRAGSS